MFRKLFPVAWAFHANTVRWPFNTLEPEDEPWPGPPFKEYPRVPAIELPASRDLSLPLADAIRHRVSCRSFRATALTLGEIGTILSFTYGIEGVARFGAKEHLERPVPSGGGLYPLEFYLIVRRVVGLDAGIYHYSPLAHALEQLKPIDCSDAFIAQLFMNQPYLVEAGAILMMTAVVERSMHKYGDRGYRYILLEAGHAAQNICLVAASLELGALPIGGFFDGFVADLLGLDVEQETVLYGVAVGRPEATDRVGTRNLVALAGD
jgi:SagB-type dehydrogenase family enzyme